MPLRVLKDVNRPVSEKHSQEAISSSCPGMLWELDDPVINLRLPSLTERVPLILLPSSF